MGETGKREKAGHVVRVMSDGYDENDEQAKRTSDETKGTTHTQRDTKGKDEEEGGRRDEGKSGKALSLLSLLFYVSILLYISVTTFSRHFAAATSTVVSLSRSVLSFSVLLLQ